jgi:uncharacterized delta-60 repeat protein
VGSTLSGTVKRLAVLGSLTFVALGLLGVSSAADLPLAGDLDASFGNGGAVTSDTGGIGGLAVQPDGKIVVAGTSNDLRILLARYLPNGSLDPSFGNGGQVETQVGAWAFAQSVALQSDGKIVVAGGSYQGDDTVLEEFTLARYNPNGSLDTTFGTDGITNTVIPEQPAPTVATTESATARSLAVLPGGDILAAGSSTLDGSISGMSSFALARYKPDGSLDPTFGDGGIVQTPSPGVGVGIAVQPDGQIVASEGNALRGYTRTGSFNLEFDRDPKLQSDDALTLQAGKIVVAGASRPAKRRTPWSLEIARYKKNGHLDSAFGARGQIEIRRVRSLLPTAISTQNHGKLLIAASYPDQARGAVVRLLRNGRLDRHFGRGGIVWLKDGAFSLASQEDGKILVGGGQPWTLDRLLGGNNCVVPGLRGETVSRATATLRKSYCRRGRTSKRFSITVTRGQVISTAPGRGARLPDGTGVDLVVSKGKRP